jgi:proteasome lid subunit RPN8/RPN11
MEASSNKAVAEVDRLYVPRSIRDEIMIHLLAAAPNEGVGLLAVGASFRDDDDRLAVEAVRFFPGTNVDHSPARYTMSPEEVIRALREIQDTGQVLGAIVHSHLKGPATPSATDVREAHYPDTLMMIVSFATQPAATGVWRVVPEDGIAVVQSVEFVIREGR